MARIVLALSGRSRNFRNLEGCRSFVLFDLSHHDTPRVISHTYGILFFYGTIKRTGIPVLQVEKCRG